MKIKNNTLFVLVFVLYSISASAFAKENKRSIDNFPDTMSLGWVKTISKNKIKSEILLQKEGFTVSYNCITNNPNWVSWKINKTLLNGSVKNVNYYSDKQLPYKNQITPKDYPNIGYDKGHMCPISDMSWNRKAIQDCMLMSNICPQKESVNKGIWKDIESLCNTWTYIEDSIYIVAGPIFFDKPTIKISEDADIFIPDAFFKVILSLNPKNSKAIGFKIYNNGEKKNITEVVASIDQIEEITGLDFFSALDDNLETKIESSSNLSKWPYNNKITISRENEFVYTTNLMLDNCFHYCSNCSGIKDFDNYSLTLYDTTIKKRYKECNECKELLDIVGKPIDTPNDSTDVYIITNPNARVYHISETCRALRSSKNSDIIKTTIKEAQKIGRVPCRFCYESVSNNNNLAKKESNYSKIQTVNNEDKGVFLTHENKILLGICSIIIIILFFIELFNYLKNKQNKELSKLSSLITEVADTNIISIFLQQFAKKDALKYTTHNWDENTDTKQKQYDNYDAFREQYCVILSQWKDSVSAKCPLLWNLISNFMLEEEGGQEWSEHNIKVGYNKFLKKWMDEHPEEQPKDMPLSEFPQDIRPGIINKRSVSCFGDIIEVFKNCIEFRDDELYSMVRSVFKSAKLKFDTDNLECLKGRNFYTDTELVEKAVRIIAANIAQHGETSEVFVEYKYEQFEKMNKMQISILHIGSFSNKDIKDSKITAENKDGAMATIKDLLRNLCDFAVESKFRVKDKILPLHISYLISDTNESGIYQIPDEECEGFKYILTFYTDFK